MRASSVLSVLTSEARVLRVVGRRSGWRAAVRLRLAHHAGTASLREELLEARDRVQRLEDEARERLRQLEHEVGERARQADDRHRHQTAWTTDLVGELQALRDATLDAQTLARVAAGEAALDADFAGRDTLVSVILPTLDRPEHLERAIASVLSQSHERWELLVIDNGSVPATAAATASAAGGDVRVRLVQTGRRGQCHARNLGLGEARGELIAYLDDDNLMGRHWLRALTATAARHPERGVFHGARVIDIPPSPQRFLHETPSIDVLRQRNVLDTGAIAHRRTTAVRWPEDEPGLGDWEVAAALMAAGHDPLAIPALASIYTATAPGRELDREDLGARVADTVRRVAVILDGAPEGHDRGDSGV